MSDATRDALLLLDGATGTELDRRGVDITLPLWSARALLDAPDVLREVHRDYLRAGAEAITTCTFRTHERSLAHAGLGDQARELTRRAVAIAREAVQHVQPDARVFGSVAPLEDCYRPDLAPPASECRAEHAQMIRHLVDAGVDEVLIETMNNADEAMAAAEAARQHAPGRWMISFCTQRDAPDVLLSGEPLRDVVPHLGDARAIGVNCIAADVALDALAALRACAPDQRLMCYANIGYADEHGAWVSTDAIDPVQYARYARTWREAGASIIGGCCGATPRTIEVIAQSLR